MDILSFILGLKKGKNSVKLQEKTVTPSDSEIVVVPDTSYDALSKVIVEAVASGGCGSNIKVTSGNVDVTTEEVITVEHGHGRIPDFCAIFPSAQLYSDYTIPSGKGEAYGYWGFSSAFINKYGYPGMFAGSIQNLGPASDGRWQYATLIMSLGSDWTPDSDPAGAIDDNMTVVLFAGAKIGKCNSTTFEYGYAGYYPLRPNTTYKWIAISGLT